MIFLLATLPSWGLVSFKMGIFSGVGYFLLFAGYLFCGSLHGEEAKESPSEPHPLMDYTDAAVYGLVEGVTEFLPVSSTGHLILTKEWMSEKGGAEAEVALNGVKILIVDNVIYLGSKINCAGG